jgi:DNA-binding transcriptional MocR family regulator
MQDVSAEWLAERLTDRTASGIARRTRSLIQSGLLPVGARLPALRDLGFRLGVSPATLCNAWAQLRDERIIEGRGRRGSWVCNISASPQPMRRVFERRVTEDLLNLAAAIPDTALLPPLFDALQHAAMARDVNAYAKTAIVPSLRGACLQTWPYRPDSFVATNGGFCGINEVLHVLIPRGSVVAVETPAATATLDILEHLGVKVTPVACDLSGPLPASLHAALALEPVAFVFQPRMNAVTGMVVPPGRLAELKNIVSGVPIWLVECDALDALSSNAPASLGQWLPKRTIHIRSLSKSVGPDLRLAVISAPSDIVRRLQAYRTYGAGWTSRLLQEAASWLLQDPMSRECIDNARAIYHHRRSLLADALIHNGVEVAPGGGLSMWLDVADEEAAAALLAQRGIWISKGAKHSLLSGNHIRVAFSNLHENYEEIGRAIARAATEAPLS